MKPSAKLTATVCAAALLSACTTQESSEKAQELPIVTIQKVVAEDVEQTVSYTATVEAFKTNNITTSTTNRIKDILVDVGYTVTAGQTVVVLDDVNIEQQKIRLDNQKREYNRAVELLNIGGGTQQDVDNLKAELDADERAYRNMVENTALITPISGVVTARNFDPGDMTGSLPILTVEQQNPVKVVVNINEQDYTKIKKGMKVKVTLDVYGDEVFDGSVYLIYPTVDATTRTFQVEVTVPNPDSRIRTGMFARVEFNYGTVRRVVVPDRAIVKMTGSGNKYVYVYSDGKVSYNQVQIGQRLSDRFVLLSGVDDGDQVVVTGQSKLSDGAAVEVMQSPGSEN